MQISVFIYLIEIQISLIELQISAFMSYDLYRYLSISNINSDIYEYIFEIQTSIILIEPSPFHRK